ncbi:MAG: TIGR03435 family protein [Candidatus Solibacter sp.]
MRVLFIGVLITGAMWAQSGDARFDVASVKPVDPNVPHNVGVKIYPGARVVISALSVKGLIAVAYGMSYWQISGGEPWLEKDIFDIEAKSPENLLPRVKTLQYSNYGIEDEVLREMLRGLLAERFHLKVHVETKIGNVYRLETKGDTTRLKATEMPADGAAEKSFGSIGFVGGRWSIFSTSMPQLAKFAAENILRAPVVDSTGLRGMFDYRQPVALPEGEANYRDNTDSFLRFVAEVGLRIERAKGPVEGLVIDRAERPAAN